jgi:SnoaL-like protein
MTTRHEARTEPDEASLRRLHDWLAIQKLVYRYSDSITRGDWELTAETLTIDAVWEIPALELHFEGSNAFLDYLRSTIATDSVLIQTAHGSVINFTGPDAATARTTINEIVRSPTVNGELHGVFFDDMSRFDDGWKFTHRLFVPLYSDAGTINGKQLSPRPVLRPTR